MELKIMELHSGNYSEIVRKRSKELPSIETLQMDEKKSTGDTLLYRLGVITPEGELVGFGMYVSGTWDPILKPGYAEVTVKVSEVWRNQGLGSWILDEIVDFANKNNNKALQTSVQDTKELELDWARKKGFKVSSHTFESQLDLSLFNLSKYESSFRKLDSLGISFTSLDDYPQDEQTQDRFWDFWWELVTDVPGMEEKPRPDNERMKKLTKDLDKKGFILAVDGDKWVAMSMIVKETDEVCYNSMTGVIQQYRGKGVAQAVKVKAIEFALQKGMKYVRTHNDSKNSPMLSINEGLGYKQKPGNYSLTKQLFEQTI